MLARGNPKEGGVWFDFIYGGDFIVNPTRKCARCSYPFLTGWNWVVTRGICCGVIFVKVKNGIPCMLETLFCPKMPSVCPPAIVPYVYTNTVVL